jgi:mRNA-degrading endonuclease RelE of RelBE toxin-antitoxin system
MNLSFRKSFQRDLKAIKDQSLLERIAAAIGSVEHAATLQEVAGLKKIEGSDDCYRIRVGDYRLGLVI